MPKVSISQRGVICIYAIQSPKEKRIYIGQTWDLYHRYKSGVSKSQRVLYRSYQKHGEENHKLFTIVEFKGNVTQADLDYWEGYYMRVYQAEGYSLLNIREAGSKGKNSEESKRLVGEKSKQYHKNNPEWSKANQQRLSELNRGKKRTPETRAAQSAAAKGKAKSEQHKKKLSEGKKGKPSPMKGRSFSPEAIERIRAAVKTRKQKVCAINQYTLEGVFVKQWPSIKEAAITLGLQTGTIGGCIRKTPNYKTCGGFIWKYANDETPVDTQAHIQTYNPKKCPVIQLSKEGVIIAEFETVKEAYEKTGVNRTSLIAACRGRRQSAGGYHWRYKPVSSSSQG